MWKGSAFRRQEKNKSMFGPEVFFGENEGEGMPYVALWAMKGTFRCAKSGSPLRMGAIRACRR